MKIPTNPATLIVLTTILVLQACAADPTTPTQETGAEPPQEAGAETTQPSLAVEATTEATEAPIIHELVPSAGTKTEANAHDNQEAATFEEKNVTTGDQFKGNRFERPFTSKEMSYLPFVDISDMGIKSDENFYYISIELVGLGRENQEPTGEYGAEFDLNKDGRSEFLLLAKPPFTSEWSTGGVKVHFDENGDIGGTRLYPDDLYTGNGYETVLFDSGKGEDPDLAWAHFVSSSHPVVELAIKRYMFEESNTFLWNVLASAQEVDPTRLYFNDTFSLAKAGSPIKKNKAYPIKQLWGFDNTCRVPLGFQATGTEPMGCSVAYESADEPPDVEFGAPAPPTCPYRACINITR